MDTVELKNLLYQSFALGFEAGINADNHYQMDEKWEQQKYFFEKEIEREKQLSLMKWHVGDKAYLMVDETSIPMWMNKRNKPALLVVWGIPPEPEDEADKHFGVVTTEDIYNAVGRLIFQAGDSFNAHFDEIEKPKEA